MGDFSLKTDDDYVVPEAQRVNTQKKRRQLVLLDESIHAIKMGCARYHATRTGRSSAAPPSSSSSPAPPHPPPLPHSYNERFLALRDLKRRMLDHMQQEEGRLAEINAELGAPRRCPRPPRSSPRRSRSAAWTSPMRTSTSSPRNWRRKRRPKGTAPTLAGSPRRPPRAAPSPSRLGRRRRRRRRRRLGRRWRRRRGRCGARGSSTSGPPCSIKRARSVASFDGALAELRAEKLRLEADLKTTDLRKLVLAQVTAATTSTTTTTTVSHCHHHLHHHHHHPRPPPPPHLLHHPSRRSWRCSSSSR